MDPQVESFVMLSEAVTERSESRGAVEASLSAQLAFGANRHSYNDVPRENPRRYLSPILKIK
jgi:hypothetical protein